MKDSQNDDGCGEGIATHCAQAAFGPGPPLDKSERGLSVDDPLKDSCERREP